MGSTHPNLVLNRLPAELLAEWAPMFRVVQLERDRVIAEAEERIGLVYFPHSGIFSFVVDLPGGGAIETAMLGRDGVFGASQALDERVSLNRVTVQARGESTIIDSAAFCRIALENATLRKLVLGYEQFFVAHIQQTAACNAVHTITQRICKWLLRMQYLAGDDLDMTQEFIAQMMGVRRTSVSGVARDLQSAGLIQYHRGKIKILDIEKIEALACECDSEIRGKYRRIFSPSAVETSRKL